MRNVISFSLFGDKPMYNVGLIRNIELRDSIYPDWFVYVYYNDTVPARTLEVCRSFKDVVLIKIDRVDVPGMFWRFMPREGVARFISRDADSRICPREKLAVDEWIASGKTLHIMRDHPHHDVCIFGGMFGLCVKNDYSIPDEINRWSHGRGFSVGDRVVDTNFIKEVLYDKYVTRGDVICHDSVCGNVYPFSRDFPTERVNYKFVGEIYDENDARFEQYKMLIR